MILREIYKIYWFYETARGWDVASILQNIF